jgi:hypothetical protein
MSHLVRAAGNALEVTTSNHVAILHGDGRRVGAQRRPRSSGMSCRPVVFNLGSAYPRC